MGTFFRSYERKEKTLDDLAETVSDDLAKFLEDCTEFWSQSSKDLGNSGLATLKARIQARSHLINIRLISLFPDASNWDQKNSLNELKELRKLAMLGKFDDDDREADARVLGGILRVGWEMQANVLKRRSTHIRHFLSG